MTETPMRNIVMNGNAEILYLNPSMKMAKIAIFIDIGENDYNDEAKKAFQQNTNKVIDYLIAEGYIPDYEDQLWLVESIAMKKNYDKI